MKLHYYPETDSLYVAFSERPSVEAHEVLPGVVADVDEDGNVVGLDFDRASTHVDLTKVETVDLPAPKAQ